MSDTRRCSNTRFADVGPRGARCLLLAFGLLLAVCVSISLSPHRIAFYDREIRPSDLELYWAEVDRIAAGEGYYEAAAVELTTRGYPTRSVFNWRTPLPMWMLGNLPHPSVGKWLLGGLAVLLLISGIVATRQQSTFGQALLLGVFLTGAIIPCWLADLYVAPLLWSGVLLGLSLVAFFFRRKWLAIGLGIAAAVFRDLALVYCLIMTAGALLRGRRTEWIGWCCGLALFGLFFLFHLSNVSRFVGTDDVVDASSWIRWNGLPSVIAMTQMNGFLLLLPQWVTAVYLCAAVLGFAGWKSTFGTQVGITSLTYLVLFSVVGQDFNQYWGILIAPLLSFGAACAPVALWQLTRSARLPALRRMRTK